MRDDLERALRDEDDPPAWLLWLIVFVTAVVLVGLLWIAFNTNAHASVLDGMQLPPEQSTGIPMLDAYSPDLHRFCTPEHHVCLDEEAGRCVLPRLEPDLLTGGLSELLKKSMECPRWIWVRINGEPDMYLYCVSSPPEPPQPLPRCLMQRYCRMA